MVKISASVGKKIIKGFTRPEGAGNFDNMDDMNIVNQVNCNIGKVDLPPTEDKHIANKKYVDDEITARHVPAGSEGEIQFNESSAFQADSALFWDNVNKILTAPTFNATDEDKAIQIDGTTVFRTGDPANENAFVGKEVFNDDDGTQNTGLGFQAGQNNKTGTASKGDQNTYLGYQAGRGADGNNTGWRNVAIGHKTLLDNTTGNQNVAIGYLALTNNTIGDFNMAIGDQALTTNTSGDFNAAIGRFALFANISGLRNCGIGHQALRFNKTGDDNVGIGEQAGQGTSGQSFDQNTFIGAFTANLLTTGSSNIFIGFQSGFRQTTNSNLLIIDNQDRGSAANETIQSLIYGTFDADPLNQEVKVNGEINCIEKSKMTIIGGFAIKLTNKTGSNSVEGQLVRTSTTTANAVQTASSNCLDIIGVIYNAGISDGSEVWVVVSGTAEVLIDAGGCALGDRIVTSATAGSAAANNAPSVAVHFQECGHVNEAIVGAGLVKATIHLL